MNQDNFDNMIPVDGHDGWYRDPKSNAILNANQSDYDKYMASYNRRSQDKEEKQTLQKEVSLLKSEMSDIKSLLLTLVKNQNN